MLHLFSRKLLNCGREGISVMQFAAKVPKGLSIANKKCLKHTTTKKRSLANQNTEGNSETASSLLKCLWTTLAAQELTIFT